ncbi:MAG: ABC transporter ATP-binding protein, partial [Cytophagaceae bacterium]
EFIFYLNKLTWPFASLGWITSIVQRAEASQARINEFLNTQTNIVSLKNSKSPIQGGIHFENVSFTYPDSGIKALRNINLHVKAGESIGIVGATGSGKSTLANLICRLYDAENGTILLDGIDIKEYDISYLRSHIGYVPQDVFLFSDTIKNNILFGTGPLDQETLEKHTRNAGLLENIKSFPKEFDTMVGERGITLSGGQKQRISIGRAIAREPGILILDDSLSAVDTKTENAILESLKGIMQKRTTVIIAHRISSVKLADQIIVLDNGSIADHGTHEELIKREGIYKTMHENQLAGMNE